MITPELVRKLAPGVGNAAVLSVKLLAACKKFGIATPLRQAHFMAQIAAESGLVPQKENLNYSAKRLTEVWPSRFPNIKAALPFANNPEALGDRVYLGRMGNKKPGDGLRYCGRGFIQLTGFNNYKRIGELIDQDLVSNPDLLLQIGVSALAAAAFWHEHNINQHADRDDLKAVTKAINGGLIGLDRREAMLKKAKQHLGIK